MVVYVTQGKSIKLFSIIFGITSLIYSNITYSLESKPEVKSEYMEKQSILRRYLVEYQKKFTLSAACLMLFFIGAPLGAIIRKGGLGLPVVISVIFFLIYFIITSIGEKSAQGGSLPPIFGTWIAIIFMTPVGLFLSYKAANDSVLFDAEIYKRFFTDKLAG